MTEVWADLKQNKIGVIEEEAGSSTVARVVDVSCNGLSKFIVQSFIALGACPEYVLSEVVKLKRIDLLVMKGRMGEERCCGVGLQRGFRRHRGGRGNFSANDEEPEGAARPQPSSGKHPRGSQNACKQYPNT